MGEMRLRIGAELAERLERVSVESGVSPEEVALAAILDHVEELEDAPLAQRRLNELDAATVPPIPHDELIRRLDLED
jgi:predicted DNA-binding protein